MSTNTTETVATALAVTVFAVGLAAVLAGPIYGPGPLIVYIFGIAIAACVTWMLTSAGPAPTVFDHCPLK